MVKKNIYTEVREHISADGKSTKYHIDKKNYIINVEHKTYKDVSRDYKKFAPENSKAVFTKDYESMKKFTTKIN